MKIDLSRLFSAGRDLAAQLADPTVSDADCLASLAALPAAMRTEIARGVAHVSTVPAAYAAAAALAEKATKREAQKAEPKKAEPEKAELRADLIPDLDVAIKAVVTAP